MLKNLMVAYTMLLVSLSVVATSAMANGELIIIFEGKQTTLSLGTVAAVNAESLDIHYSTSGATVSFAITKNTEICLNGNPRSSWKRIRVGQGIIVASDSKTKNAVVIRDGGLTLGAEEPKLRCKLGTTATPIRKRALTRMALT